MATLSERGIPCTADGDECWRCQEYPEEISDHDTCHGWFHCGPECCGECPFCEDRREDLFS